MSCLLSARATTIQKSGNTLLAHVRRVERDLRAAASACCAHATTDEEGRGSTGIPMYPLRPSQQIVGVKENMDKFAPPSAPT
ncbi:hypothetical protein DICSQDRAFT_174910 [Dichomitus squalens LYAD-421 SS1]|uniref:Uncharacterized protein n=1 Tax=Dichomitus squalens (strain LYAD-421) TaxID=732165 RepID=R7SL47_DICSQ|nr:uncharacterized protein DICSQDRAFT_174910 [Dichomitus squalens LYAD-421 SS1]EJF56460.1 hypothetical protein DICSQDRAFT_174910 [Dichomitus squalens LYAD-421 SS1]